MSLKKDLTGTGWWTLLEPYLYSEDWLHYSAELAQELKNKQVFPKGNYLRVFKEMNLSDVSVVILGQDPYHTPGTANGLAFAVNPGRQLPPSLRNILKELESDLDAHPKTDGSLLGWHKQGVMLLNTALTVVEGEPGSHADIWRDFTDHTIKAISDNKDFVVFILWGNHARSKSKLIDMKKHAIIESAHPSPFSVKNFWGTKPFSRANELLRRAGKKEINWLDLDGKERNIYDELSSIGVRR